MALSDLLAGMQEEAAAEEAQLDAETRAGAARMEAAAHDEARLLEERVLRAAEDELRGEAEARRANARLAAAANVREAREEAFQVFLAAVRGRLDSVRESSGYPSVLRELVREILMALPGAAVLHVDPRDDRLATELAGELGLELEIAATLETAGGVELARDDRVVRNTVEERFANAEPALRLLFGREQRVEVS
jgi:vacuolar-type H+-ATPase subunit E/Vma4